MISTTEDKENSMTEKNDILSCIAQYTCSLLTCQAAEVYQKKYSVQ